MTFGREERKRGERPRTERRRVRELSSEEIERLLTAATSGYRVAVATAIFTGARQSEQLGLRWKDVDFEREVIRVRGQLGRDGTWVASPKTEHAEREITLFPALARLCGSIGRSRSSAGTRARRTSSSRL